MKINQLKSIIENEIKTLKEQRLSPTNPGLTMGNPPPPPPGGGGVGITSTNPGLTSMGGTNMSGGVTDAQEAQLVQALQQAGGKIRGSGQNRMVTINLFTLIKLLLRGSTIFLQEKK
tara:strand:- start:63 stop:413 length:351 start_codon:yes stop_codon:yes gene_type:complete